MWFTVLILFVTILTGGACLNAAIRSFKKGQYFWFGVDTMLFIVWAAVGIRMIWN